AFRDFAETLKVGVGMGFWFVDELARARLRREMNHACEAMPGKRLRDCCAVGKISLYEFEPSARAQDAQASPLQRRIVIRIEIVQSNDAPAFIEQRAGDVKADEARRPRHQYRPIRHPIPTARPARSGPLYLPSGAPRNTRGPAIARRVTKPYQGGQIQRRSPRSASCPQTDPNSRCAGLCFPR